MTSATPALKDHQQARLRTLDRLQALGEPRTELLADVVSVIEAELVDFDVSAVISLISEKLSVSTVGRMWHRRIVQRSTKD